MLSGDQIAADALRYEGHAYVYGDWDCSGFVNHVLGQDLRVTLPGGVRGYRGPPPHGPVVSDYATWAGAITVGSPARGDLAVWPGDGPDGHIGIVLGPDEMISALDQASGTVVTPVHGYGPPGVDVVYRRVLSSLAGTALGGSSGQPGGLRAAAEAVLLVAGMAGMVIAAAAVLGTVAAAGGAWLISKAVTDAA